jgi:hypothetical protein
MLDIPLADRTSVLRALARGEFEGLFEGKEREIRLPSDARLPAISSRSSRARARARCGSATQ